WVTVDDGVALESLAHRRRVLLPAEVDQVPTPTLLDVLSTWRDVADLPRHLGVDRATRALAEAVRSLVEHGVLITRDHEDTLDGERDEFFD
ncbi:hypothetical protein H8J56_27075, partial [Klebsiella sp. Kps]|uniref:hypothetical protein n=1 Tax=Klebsiella sp. Kps TaxID=2758579 RepID=UPI001646AD99